MPTDSDADRDPSAGKTADDDAVVGANPGYALGQVALALSASQVHEDPELRERVRARAQTWTQVFEGMLSGTLAVGSRTPVPATPGWATLKVVTGGFATGDLLAGGVLLVHEHQLLGELGLPPDDSGRASLNAYYLSDAGFARGVPVALPTRPDRIGSGRRGSLSRRHTQRSQGTAILGLGTRRSLADGLLGGATWGSSFESPRAAS